MNAIKSKWFLDLFWIWYKWLYAELTPIDPSAGVEVGRGPCSVWSILLFWVMLAYRCGCLRMRIKFILIRITISSDFGNMVILFQNSMPSRIVIGGPHTSKEWCNPWKITKFGHPLKNHQSSKVPATPFIFSPKKN